MFLGKEEKPHLPHCCLADPFRASLTNVAAIVKNEISSKSPPAHIHKSFAVTFNCTSEYRSWSSLKNKRTVNNIIDISYNKAKKRRGCEWCSWNWKNPQISWIAVLSWEKTLWLIFPNLPFKLFFFLCKFIFTSYILLGPTFFFTFFRFILVHVVLLMMLLFFDRLWLPFYLLFIYFFRCCALFVCRMRLENSITKRWQQKMSEKNDPKILKQRESGWSGSKSRIH